MIALSVSHTFMNNLAGAAAGRVCSGSEVEGSRLELPFKHIYPGEIEAMFGPYFTYITEAMLTLLTFLRPHLLERLF